MELYSCIIKDLEEIKGDKNLLRDYYLNFEADMTEAEKRGIVTIIKKYLEDA